MDINQIRREVKWYTDEVALNERDVKALEAKLSDLKALEIKLSEAKRKVESNHRKLEQYIRDLADAERREREKRSGR